jgi:hypothetical protein
MSIEVRIPKEITEYREKIIFGLSGRQLLCFVIAIVLAVGSYILLTGVMHLTMQVASYIVIIEALPLMAIGFVRKNGLPFEKYVALWWRHRNTRGIRLYEPELLCDAIDHGKGGKNVWIKEKRNKSDRKLSEASGKGTGTLFVGTEKNREAKREAVLRKIEAARQESREADRRAKKTAKEAART